MPKSRRQLRVLLPALERGEARSSLFWWMLDHHDELAAAALGRRPHWQQLCERFASLDLKDGHGSAPSPEAARRTWRNVRAFVAEEALKLRQPKPRAPSRIPLGSRPQVAGQAARPLFAEQADTRNHTPNSAPAVAALTGNETASEGVNETISRVLDQLAAMDRKTFGP